MHVVGTVRGPHSLDVVDLYPLDDRFEHHDGMRVFEVAPGRLGIVSHGWADSRYVHLWEQV